MRPLRVLIVSDSISLPMGDEASLPLCDAMMFSQRGGEVRLACHERVQAELREALPELEQRVPFVRNRIQRTVCRLAGALPYRPRDLLAGEAIYLSTQARIREIAVDLARTGKIDAMPEQAPIAPDWGGPADYVDASCAILVHPTSKEGFVDGLAEAIVGLARSAERFLRKRLTAAT